MPSLMAGHLTNKQCASPPSPTQVRPGHEPRQPWSTRPAVVAGRCARHHDSARLGWLAVTSTNTLGPELLNRCSGGRSGQLTISLVCITGVIVV
jgi:hypothetical protein